MKKRFLFMILFWVVSLSIFFNPITTILKPFISGLSYGAEASSLYYILDASGSMWGRVDGQMKIESARYTMTNLIKEMPEELLYSLTVYGNLKKGDCSDITEIIPLGKIDRSNAVELIEKINPKGKTPIAKTIEKTVYSIKNKETATTNQEDNTIILISDGLETCGDDPCAITSSLKSSGIKFIIHVVGFDVDTKASEQLACIAEAGGGRYFSTKNAKELLSILSSVQKSVAEKKSVELKEKQESDSIKGEIALNSKSGETPRVEKTVVEQKLTSSSQSIRIKAKGPGKIAFKNESWLKKPYSWKLIDPETGEERGKFSTLETTIVKPGYYQIVWDQYEHDSSDVPLTEVIQVESGKTVEIPLMTAIRLNLPSWISNPNYWGLRDPQTLERVVTFRKLETFLVPAGEYDIIWRQAEHSAQEVAIQRVKIMPDKINEVTISTAINPIPSEWMQKKIHYWGLKPVRKSNGQELGQSRTSSSETTTISHQQDSFVETIDPEKFVVRFSDKFSPQLVPSGKYRLIYDLSEHGSSDSYLGEIDIVEGKMNEFQINTGVLLIPPEGLKPPYFVDFIELNKEESDDNRGNNGVEDRDNNKVIDDKLNKVRINGSFGPIALKPGKYRIDYRQEEHGASTTTIVDEFELEAGQLVEIEL